MPQKVFAINGRFFDVAVTELKRDFQILDNDDNAGRTIDGTMVRDVIGTFYNYTLKIQPRNIKVSEYHELHDLISSPIDYVVLTIVLGNKRMDFNAYITKGSDNFRMTPDGKEVWTGLTCSFVAMEPQRRPV